MATHPRADAADPDPNRRPPPKPAGLGRLSLITSLILLVLGGVLPTDPLRDVATSTGPPDAALVATPAYLLAAPVWRLLDTVALLGAWQHGAFVATALAVYAVWRVQRRRGRGRGGVRGWVAETGATGLFLMGLLTLYAATAFLPHPTMQLNVTDPELVRVDFHSHTGHSRDAADRFGVEWNRRWHRRTGYDVAYVTDHSTWAGIPAAAASNPDLAGEDVILLGGTEAWFKGDHAVALGDSLRTMQLMDSTRWRFEPDSLLRRATDSPAMLVVVLPLKRLDRVLGWTPETPDGVVALEIVDGSPKGLGQSREDRGHLLETAEQHDLALVSGSNTHGTGQVAAAWTLLRIPGWRTMAADHLEGEIDRTLRAERGKATRVIERTMPHASSGVGLAATVPALVWHAAATMGWPERMVWFAYTGLLLIIPARVGAGRRR